MTGESVAERVKHKLLKGLDEPIYRIFQLKHFWQALEKKTLALVKPSKWEDPYEDMCMSTIISDLSVTPFKSEPLEDLLPSAHAQCWSYEGSSDTLLRAYSRVIHDPQTKRNKSQDYEGVQVRTTPRALLDHMKVWAKANSSAHFYLRQVNYMDETTIGNHGGRFIEDSIHRAGRSAMSDPNVRAELLFTKRNFFRHEDEVRLVCVGADIADPEEPFFAEIDPTQLFQSVSFDPRLVTFEKREREAVARRLGYQGPFPEDGTYINIFFDLRLKNGWGNG